MILRLAFVGRAILKADLVLLEDLLCGFPHHQSRNIIQIFKCLSFVSM